MPSDPHEYMATDAPVLAVTRAIAKDGDVRRGHGLEVRFEGVRVDPAPFGDFKIDVIGPAFEACGPRTACSRRRCCRSPSIA